MASLADYIDALDQKPYYRVYINGTPVFDVVSIRWEASYEQNSATCKLITATKYNFDPTMVYTVEVLEGYNGFSVRTFTGYIDDVERTDNPYEWAIVCRDVLKKAIETWLDDVGVEYASTQAEDAVRDLLSKAGIGVQASATDFTIGDVEPAKFKLVSVMEAALQIAALIGWHIWATPDGTVIFDYKKPLPNASSMRTYSPAATHNGTDGNILKYKYVRTDRNLRNRITVVGYKDIRAVASGPSPYVPNGYYRDAILSSELIDTQSMADTIAPWMLNDLNHLTESVEMDILGNPHLRIGSTIHLTLPAEGVDANFFVFSISSQNDGDKGEFLQHLTVVGGSSSPISYKPGPGGPGEGGTPECSFTYKQVAWGDPTYVLYVDASATQVPDGTAISQYVWSWGDGTPDTTTTRPNATHKYTDLGPVDVTLTVTAANSFTCTACKTIKIGDPTDTGFAPRIIYAGGTSFVYCSPDSGLTWNSVAVPSKVNHIASNILDDEGIVLAGCEGGRLLSVLDYGKSIATLHTFGAAVRSVYINFQDPTQWLVGLSNGQLWLTLDEGSTWMLLHTFSGAIAKYAFSDPMDPNHLLVPGNTFVSESFDGGSSFINRLLNWSNGAMTGVVGIAWHLATHMVAAVTGGTARIGYSSDDGTSWSSAVGVTGTTPTAVTGGNANPGDFAATMSGRNYPWVTEDGVNWSPGGNFLALAEAEDLRYDWSFYQTLLAGG